MSVDKKSSYYDVGGVEVIDVMKAKLTPEQYQGYLLGNVIKYSLRMNHKGSFHRDNEKVGVYSGLLKETELAEQALYERVEYIEKEKRALAGRGPTDTCRPKTAAFDSSDSVACPDCGSPEVDEKEFKLFTCHSYFAKEHGFVKDQTCVLIKRKKEAEKIQ